MIQIDKLPDSWETITLQQFNKTLNLEVIDNDDSEEFVIDYLTKVAAVLLDIPVADIYVDYKDVFKVIQRLSFFLYPPDYNASFKAKLKLIKVNKLSYDKYIDLMNVMQRMEQSLILNDLHSIINIILIDNSEDIEQMNMMDVYQSFFLFKKQLKKYLIHSQMQTIGQIVKQKFRQLFNRKDRK